MNCVLIIRVANIPTPEHRETKEIVHAHADLIIGCDGAYSSVRNSLMRYVRYVSNTSRTALFFHSRLAMVVRFVDSQLRNIALIFEIDWTSVRNTSLMATAS